ncbi:DUF481 domain-containing protein, partial [Marisediminitalea sp.]|uniref:DUF481 domain-containing protein n=1 Tax=Marisediminitalea sp. TaxID=2662268 RepID=UPI003512B351
MVHRIIVSALVSLVLSSFSANAADKDLIRTLYHADFVEYDDEPKDRFTLDGELGVIFASGNTNASSIKSSLKSEHETNVFANQYWVEFLYKQSEVDGDEGRIKQTTDR